MDFVIDNMPVDAVPLYDCVIGANPVVFKSKKDDVLKDFYNGTMIRAEKTKDGRRYEVPLQKINERILEEIGRMLSFMQFNNWNMADVVLCIRGKEIGLACQGKIIMSTKEVLIVKDMDEIKNGITEEEITEYLKNEVRNRTVNALVESRYLETLADGFAKIESKNTAVRDMVMGLRTFTDFRKLKYMKGTFEKRKEAIREGLMGVLWGAQIWIVKELPYGEVRIYGKDEVNKDFPSITKSKIILNLNSSLK